MFRSRAVGLIGGWMEEEKRRKKILHTVKELQKSEVKYVRRLQLLVNLQRKTVNCLPSDVHKQMFHDIESIYNFHNDHLLPDIQARLHTWKENRRIGDVMKKLVPFLKIYTDYVIEIEARRVLVDTWKQKSSSFAGIIREAESLEAYDKNKVKDHMFEPVQRIGRYKLLLTAYLEQLKREDDPDRSDTVEALQLVGETAGHIQGRMQQAEDKLVLMKLQRQLGVKIVNSTRRFITEGKLRQVKSSGKCPERTLHLFTDMLVVSAPSWLGNCFKKISSRRYRVKHKISLTDAVIEEGRNLQFPHTFYVRAKDVTIELAAKDCEEKQKWLEAFSAQLLEP